jgi:hypothetical protein
MVGGVVCIAMEYTSVKCCKISMELALVMHISEVPAAI